MNRFRMSLIAASLAGAFAFGTAQAQGAAGTGTQGGASHSPAATPGTSANPGGKAAAGKDAGKDALSRADRSFVTDAARSDAAELATSKVALQKASDPQVKQFAQRMIDDHTKTSQQLKSIVSAKGMEMPPPEPDRAHKAMLDKMERMSGAEFDRAYMKAQVADHEKAVNLFEKQSKSGKDAELKQFATEHLPHLREHLKMAQSISKSDQARGSGGMGGGSATAGGMATGSTSRSSGTPSAGATGGTMGGDSGGPGAGMSGTPRAPTGTAAGTPSTGSRTGTGTTTPSSSTSPGASGSGTGGAGGSGMGSSTGGGTGSR